jgi:hypothetical protein
LQDEQGIGGQLNSTLAGIGQQTQGALTGLGQGAQGALARYTPQSDSSIASPAMQSLTAEIARQQGLAAQSSGIQQGAGAIQGANASLLAASNLGTGALAGKEELGSIAQAGQLENEPLTSKQAALTAQNGALLADALGKIQQQNNTNAITEAGLGLTKARIQEELQAAELAQQGEGKRAAAAAAAAAARNAATIAGENFRNQESIAARQAEAAAKANAASGGTKLLPTSEQNTLYQQLDSAIAHIPTLQANGLKDSKGNIITANPNQQQITNALVQAGWPQALVDAAFELRQQGYILPSTARQMRALGLKGGFYNGAPIKVRANPTGQAISGTPGGGSVGF